MEKNRTDQTDLSVLVVSCMSDLPDTLVQAAAPYTFSASEADASAHLAATRFGCVVAVIDPSSRRSIRDFEALQTVAQEQETPLASVSAFNPPWIENLMQQLGVVAHFKAFPSSDQIAQLLPAQTHSGVGTGTGANT